MATSWRCGTTAPEDYWPSKRLGRIGPQNRNFCWPGGGPGAVISIQTFGDLVNFHPHLHCLVTDGCFMPNGWFHVLPEIDLKKLENLFRHKVFKMLLREKKISRELVDKLLSWKNSGFNIHNQVKIQSHDSHGRESLAQYVLRSPFSQQKMTYQKDTQTVLYRSKMNLNLKRNFALFPVLDWIAEITAHIPNKREQLIRYFGAYSNVSRGKRKKEKVEEKPTQVTEVPPPPVSRELKRRWSYFIRKVYETDPLVCPKCSGEMHIISYIDQGAVIKKILQHLGLWEECHARPAGVLLDLVKPARTQFNSSLIASEVILALGILQTRTVTDRAQPQK